MKFAHRFALIISAAALLSGSALAAVPRGKDMGPVAKPLSAWLVGPSQASAFDEKDHPEGKGCLMVSEFDNGMIIGFHAREAGVVGMTVDTKQSNMAAGDPHSMGMNLGQNAYVLDAVASDPSTLSVSLDEAGGGKKVVEKLTALGNFRLMIENKPYYFATTGFTDGLARLQACMGSMMAVPLVVSGTNATSGKIVHDAGVETMKVTSSGHNTPLALAMPSLAPMGYKFVLDDVDPMTPLDWQQGDDWVAVMQKALEPHDLKMVVKGRTIRIQQRTGDSDPVIEDAQYDDAMEATNAGSVPEGVWAAAKGEDLASVLESWGLMAGVNVKADLEGSLKLPRDVHYEGAFSDAVQKLLAQFSGKNKPVGTYSGAKLASMGTSSTGQRPRAPDASIPRVTAPSAKLDDMDAAPLEQMIPIPDPADAPKTVKKTADKKPSALSKEGLHKISGNWKALEGTSLRDVLEHWGEDAGVNVVWQADGNYPLPETINTKGKFEEAVMAALAQYEDQGVRPTAQLNRDPKTGERALIIKSSRL